MCLPQNGHMRRRAGGYSRRFVGLRLSRLRDWSNLPVIRRTEIPGKPAGETIGLSLVQKKTAEDSTSAGVFVYRNSFVPFTALQSSVPSTPAAITSPMPTVSARNQYASSMP